MSRVMLVKTTESPEMENAQKLNDTFYVYCMPAIVCTQAQILSLSSFNVNKLWATLGCPPSLNVFCQLFLGRDAFLLLRS